MSFYFSETNASFSNDNAHNNSKSKNNNGIHFECNLETKQCLAISEKTGLRCKRQTRAMLPYCWQHTRSKYGVKPGPSKIPNAGKGLYAMKKFKANDRVVPYDGEIVTKETLQQRYGDYTAPYALELSKSTNRNVDAACSRGIGSYTNHKIRPQSNSKFTVYKGRAGFIKATKQIKPGDEIYVSYGNNYHFNEPTQFETKRTPNKKLS